MINGRRTIRRRHTDSAKARRRISRDDDENENKRAVNEGTRKIQVYVAISENGRNENEIVKRYLPSRNSYFLTARKHLLRTAFAFELGKKTALSLSLSERVRETCDNIGGRMIGKTWRDRRLLEVSRMDGISNREVRGRVYNLTVGMANGDRTQKSSRNNKTFARIPFKRSSDRLNGTVAGERPLNFAPFSPYITRFLSPGSVVWSSQIGLRT